MKAIVTNPFCGAPDGAIYPKNFQPGDIVDGDLARVAVRENWATEDGTAQTVTTEAPVPIPEEWQTFNAAETIALARALGADDSVRTKAAATVFIEAEIAPRVEAAKA
jgi:hypothetical protein